MPEVVGRLRTPRLSAAPASPVVGEMYYDTGTNVLYYWNGTTWLPARGGPLAVQTTRGANPAYLGYGAPQWVSINPGGTALMLFYTPPVNCWWEVSYHIGLIQALSAAYYYATTELRMFGPADADGVSTAAKWLEMQHASVQTFVAHTGSYVYKLNAGVAYSVGVWWDGAAASWQIHQGPEYMHIQGRAFAR